MPKMQVFKFRDIEKTLKKLGCRFLYHIEGSHQTRYSPKAEEKEFIVVKVHGRDCMIIPTFVCMLKNAWFTYQEFLDAYNSKK